MKVIHILDELKFSGAEVMYIAAAPVFQDLGCELSVVNSNKNLGVCASLFEQAGYEVFHKPYPSSRFKSISYCFQFIRFLKKNRYNVVHIHTNLFSMAFCAWMAGCRSVYTFHSVFYSRKLTRWYHRLQRWVSKRIFRCVFQTIGDSVYAQEKNYYKNDSIKIYNWYNSNRYYPAREGEREIFRRELGIDPGTLVLISIGGCSPIKRHWEIINALPEVVAKYPDTIYLHLGEGTTLSEEQELVNQSDISGHVRFCGNQTDIRKYLIASDIYLMTSVVEGVSITAIETMACGIPEILYNSPGLRDFNNEMECTLLVEQDPTSLANGIIWLYENKEHQKKLTDNALKLVSSHFDMKKNATEIFKLYRKNP
ncbi:MAG: glycosyltransferase [Bacteroidales bacterium]|jgi:glycosyltransferase involved in cell wall biosynthesis|nr:glycosyltransferase [Bacteroidales bacterium]